MKTTIFVATAHIIGWLACHTFAQSGTAVQFYDSTKTVRTGAVGWKGGAQTGHVFIDGPDGEKVKVQGNTMTVHGTVAAQKFVGDGSGLTNVAGGTSSGPAPIAAGSITDDKIKSMSWSKLTGVPPGFADGTDNEATAAPGSDTPVIPDNSITAAKIKNGEVGTGDLANGAVTDAKISSSAKIQWSKIAVPADIADGDDKGVTGITAGSGLSKSGTSDVTLSVDFNDVAAKSHSHSGYASASHSHSEYASSGHGHDEYAPIQNPEFTGDIELEKKIIFSDWPSVLAQGRPTFEFGGFNDNADANFNFYSHPAAHRDHSASLTIHGKGSNFGYQLSLTHNGSKGIIQSGIGDIQLAPASGKVFIHNAEVVTSSDARLKTDVQPLCDALSKVAKMKGVYYRWKKPEGTSDCSSRQIGFIAQSVKESVPELVTANDKGYLALAYDRIPALLVEAMKEQQQIIERQKRDIASLRSSHVTLQQRMRALEGRFERMFISLSGSDKKSTLSSALDAGGNRQAAIQ